MNTIPSRQAKLAVALLSLAATGAWAADYGTVLSSTPVIASVPVTQRECVDEQVLYQQRNSGAGALLGAIAGAAVGNSVGSGAGRAAATGIGLILGSQIGDRVEADGAPPVASTVQRCRNVTAYERRTVGYDVVYEYQGVRRSARLPQDPGAQIALDVNVAPAGMASPQAQAAVAPPVYAPEYPQPYEQAYEQNYEQPRVVYSAQPRVFVNPWPAIAIGAAYYGYYRGGGGWGRHGYRR